MDRVAATGSVPDAPSAPGTAPGPNRRGPAMLVWLRRHLLIVVPAVLVVAAAIAVPLAVSGSSGGSRPGAASAPAAAKAFVVAIRAGHAKAAMAVSCPSFATQVQQAAHTAHLAGFTVSLGAVKSFGADATAVLVFKANVGGTVERTPYTLQLQRQHSRWLVCGRD